MNHLELAPPIILRPVCDRKSHPVSTGNYVIPTNAIMEMCENVGEWIENRSPGGVVYSKPRVGKTRAIRYLREYLKSSDAGSYPSFLVNCRQYRIPTEKVFFEDILLDVGHAVVYSGAANIKRNRIVQFLYESTYSANTNRLVLVLDDAQRLQHLQYGWLMDIYNDLDRQGVYMTALLFGQDEILQSRTSLKASNKEQILGRFMVHTFKFRGIQSIDDLSMCLKGYDENSEYPENSGWSFTRFFFPEAFNRGFRLQNYATELYGQYKAILNKQTGKIEIPMQYVALSIEYCLKNFGVDGKNIERLAKSHWHDAIIKSGYLNSIK